MRTKSEKLRVWIFFNLTVHIEESSCQMFFFLNIWEKTKISGLHAFYPKMAIFKIIQKRYAIIGISSSVSSQKYPFSKRVLCGFSLLGCTIAQEFLRKTSKSRQHFHVAGVQQPLQRPFYFSISKDDTGQGLCFRADPLNGSCISLINISWL